MHHLNTQQVNVSSKYRKQDIDIEDASTWHKHCDPILEFECHMSIYFENFCIKNFWITSKTYMVLKSEFDLDH